ncbi:MAG TPA: dihydropteroate synthase [Balneolales bacterium]|nr:dihydropteroate synthase [Balneolales bacterium]
MVQSTKKNITSEHLVIKDKVLDLSHPQVMGILNVTPDSFSDGGRFINEEIALDHIYEMIEAGASIIDVGGESTRPGSDPVDVSDELNRVIPILKRAIPKYPDTFFSIDTTKYEVAREALKIGAHMINDISGLQKDPRLADLCAKYDVPLIIMHSKGDPKTMQKDPEYDDVVEEVSRFFKEKISLAQAKGATKIIIDPGIGFGKKLEHNLELLGNLETFRKFGCPILIGASRKSMISHLLGKRPVPERLSATLAIHYDSMMRGARIIRVHDVKEASDTVAIFNAIQRYVST